MKTKSKVIEMDETKDVTIIFRGKHVQVLIHNDNERDEWTGNVEHILDEENVAFLNSLLTQIQDFVFDFHGYTTVIPDPPEEPKDPKDKFPVGP